MDNTDCVDFAHKKRTDGDGMESNVVASNEFETKININQEPKIVQKSHNDKSNKFRLIELTPPKTMVFDKKKRNIYSKGPKFVPYEPYTAAIKPIIPNNKQIAYFKKRSSRNNLDINVLISQMSQIDTNPSEFKKKVKNMNTSESSKNRENMEWTSEKVDMQKQIDELSRENETLKDQIKQQAQVNKELKTMLVASMGEDLETQVQSLNDDKRHLANALLSSAQHLSTHQEQTEWLAGQCEVWRSKFLASSLMVEELAGWKRALNQRTEELHQVLRQILEERCRARDLVLYTYRNLYTLHDGWLANIAFNEVQIDNCKILFDRSLGSVNLNASKPETANLLDLASANLKLSENLSCGIEKCDDSKLNLAGLPVMTEVESAAEKLLATPLEVSRNHDLPMNALVYHAHSKSSGTPPVACCTHCNGQVQLL